jgi:lysophospholipase L1-like esterase
MKAAAVFCLGVILTCACLFSFGTFTPRHHPTPADPQIAVPDGGPIHQAIIEHKGRNPVDVLFLGDSITQLWQNVPWIWDENFGKFKPLNAGVMFDQIQQLRWRVDNGTLDGIHPRVIVLLIGINNLVFGDDTPEITAKGIQSLLLDIQSKQPQARILLLGLFPQRYFLKSVVETNKLLKPLADGQRVVFLDIGSQIPLDNFPDGTHPSPAGYREWAKLMLPTLAKMYDDAPLK